MPYYAAYPSAGSLVNCLAEVLDDRQISSFHLSRVAGISPTTARKIASDEHYIPSPDVLERICLSLGVQPGELLCLSPKLEEVVAVGSGV